jgi:hypothetical protein
MTAVWKFELRLSAHGSPAQVDAAAPSYWMSGPERDVEPGRSDSGLTVLRFACSIADVGI